MKRILLTILLILGMFFVSQTAHAQMDVSEPEKGYGYVFDDDPLQAGGLGPQDATIRVRPTAARVTLIRPRTSFVKELLRSVEDI